MKTLMGLLACVYPQGDAIPQAIQALPEVIGDSVGDAASNELDIGRLLAVTVKALTAAETATPKRRALLLTLATQAAERALWVSVFDPTNPEHMR